MRICMFSIICLYVHVDVILNATSLQAARTVLDGSHGVRLYAAQDNGQRGTLTIVGNGFDTVNGTCIAVRET